MEPQAWGSARMSLTCSRFQCGERRRLMKPGGATSTASMRGPVWMESAMAWATSRGLRLTVPARRRRRCWRSRRARASGGARRRFRRRGGGAGRRVVGRRRGRRRSRRGLRRGRVGSWGSSSASEGCGERGYRTGSPPLPLAPSPRWGGGELETRVVRPHPLAPSPRWGEGELERYVSFPLPLTPSPSLVSTACGRAPGAFLKGRREGSRRASPVGRWRGCRAWGLPKGKGSGEPDRGG